MRRGWRGASAAALLALLGLLSLPVLPAAVARAVPAAGPPSASVSQKEAGVGGTVTVTGRGWRPHALLTLLICGQNMIGGTNTCANGDGRTVTTDDRGAFRRALPVAEPPTPCPCVVHVAAVTGAAAAADAPFQVAGHPVAPLPRDTGGGRLAVLDRPRLTGSSGLLTWFGAPPQRELAVTVGNLGSAPAKDPVFRVGTSHGVYPPKWEDQQWRGTVPAGRRAEVRLPVELAAGAHGGYLVSLTYGGRLLVEQPWQVGRPWGVTLFWVLLCLVVPAAVFRIGMAVVDRVRPHRPDPAGTAPAARPRSATGPRLRRPARRRTGDPGNGTGLPAGPGTGTGAGHATPASRDTNRTTSHRTGRDTGHQNGHDTGRGAPGRPPEGTAALPWFTPDTAPSTTATTRPPSKGSA
ncbi:hypothetical protein MUU72_18365 [Streptomyces sp. RS10V-4]|uniref:hypothetical protein n=1 Tax=Streptomyces rhizoryzae TaxID=2932493 RepID=UPI002003AE27|nr:hypothetical protein [Streptomyces rhizoryzae]MCK7625050.1 hypothetical protein [Streptomyces rhizoryzae]